MNYNNLAQNTNFLAGSSKLQLTPFYLQSVNIPGVSISHPEIGGRSSHKMKLTGDTVQYNPLSIELIIDEDFLIFHEFMDIVNQNISSETGTFGDLSFDFWVEVTNSKGNKLFKVEFDNCRIESIADVFLNTQDIDSQILSVSFLYDKYRIIKGTSTPTLE